MTKDKRMLKSIDKAVTLLNPQDLGSFVFYSKMKDFIEYFDERESEINAEFDEKKSILKERLNQ